MNIYLPKNIFTSVIAASMPENLKGKIHFQSSSIICSSLEKDNNGIALVSTTDLLNHRELFVSRKFGISFESSLCNSYLYFSNDRSLKSLNLAGDVSSLEVILGKILFKELYDSDVEIKLSVAFTKEAGNLLLVGEQNFYDERLFDGISFSEEMIELISLPFVNFVLASANESLLKEKESLWLEIIPNVYNMFESLQEYFSFTEKTLKYVKQNISSLVMEFDMQDVEGILQLIRMPYYYGIIKDMIDIKFV